MSLSIRDLHFAYGGDDPVLAVEHFEVDEAERIFVFGPSGSGKTTLLGIIAGMLEPSRGTLEVLGTDLRSLPRAQRDRWRGEHLGVIFQLFNLLPYLDVFDNIALPCRLSTARRKRLERPLDEEVARLAERLEITPWLGQPVSELSVGQQQRVAAARALIGRPGLIIADEPTSALDVERRERFLELLFTACLDAGAALVFVSHDRSLARRFDRAVDLSTLNRA